jgi:hypothetical protein
MHGANILKSRAYITFAADFTKARLPSGAGIIIPVSDLES